MTKDEIAELRRCAEELRSWLNKGRLVSPPFETIRTIARLANKAADTIESSEPRRRYWLFDNPWKK